VKTGSSNFTYNSGLNLAQAFLEKITSDTTNPVSATAPYASVTNWIDFDSPFRAWGPQGGAFPSSTNLGPCLAGDECEIWDWRLANSGQNPVLNTSGNPAILNSNEPFTGASNCPAAVDGSYTVTDQQGHTFLANAIEVVGDGLGNENGLCESGETCIYAPNFGSYQGQGDFTGETPCIFHDGSAVKGVTMYAFPTNGI
jgi:hypothetical protein